MPEQSTLEGFEPPPPPPPANDSLFFAILPTPDAQERIGHQATLLRNAYRLNGFAQAASRLHVSLINVGRFAGVPKAVVDAATAAAASVRMAPFDLSFHRAMSFRGKPNGRPLVLTSDDGDAGAVALERALGAAVQRAGLARSDPTFLPHLTMLYDRSEVLDHAIEPIVWTVREFVLIHSLVGQTRYTVLGRWPLQP